ncbi:hypothetical protein PGB34_01360 [Xenophilus arseniciresistens]|uniref:Uncharacterized protein n=1 Tax=Xenophilus arseniciresistens TaxID=1283306 RepID=A0AAE3N3S7_9BURK|nr:hypothetical protein [Xenophilus arseniciresistens]MDA7415000.1 hypothetical protein [Xenophilus arseniciresistens]
MHAHALARRLRAPLPLLCLALVLAGAGQLHAQPGPRAAANDNACFDVEVNGQRAPASFECLSQKLRPQAQPGAEGAAAAAGSALASESIASRPSNQLGLFNRAATGHRMGNQFGRSVYPQRPDEGMPPPMVLPRR